MKFNPLLFLFCMYFLLGQSACISYTYIVRHADKGEGNDPDLLDAGSERAVALAQLLKSQGIQEIYSTNFKRTRQTAAPLADSLGLNVILYGSDTLQSFVTHRLVPLGKKRLVVGHSNTILSIAAALGASPTLQSVPDDDYDNLLIVKRRRFLNDLTISLTETTYGLPSPAQ
ncbi:MAG: histidine phosphatase family protein [Saprospirales bacterium]|nr:histidine phosphatase family protein [Saprospirales bacterium]MBK6904632.1 histidine phosphatase family protein [Saprospirales bacterium]MBK7336265.1 histidine phosphatase family protein [Saprospirales bacterium]